ncbi:MAG: EF-hand domain-containing protein [Gemmataceae bacterium]|nr:EF-hand domain-containing protein [Gemmataceae bacterium]
MDYLFKRHDKSNDGNISKAESLHAVSGMFGRADKNNDGLIDRTTLRECCISAETARQGGKSSPRLPQRGGASRLRAIQPTGSAEVMS